ncbi:protein phosphatase 1K, mitochondrial-like [Tubulanus polymorphus]|uniref:protein phosphatase 1K, mitochondrial-like n=1 Tax=Tubulanus polymorphus TaxID=672921 RepID=UPI003DA5D0B6
MINLMKKRIHHQDIKLSSVFRLYFKNSNTKPEQCCIFSLALLQPAATPPCRLYSTPLSDPENKGVAQRGINFDTLGTWDNRLNFPLLVEQSKKAGLPIPKITLENIGHSTVLGRRTVNEDRLKISQLTPDVSYFAMFDGHGGAIAADFACDFLEDHIKFWMRDESNLLTVLKQSFIDLNNKLSRHMYYDYIKKPINPKGKGEMNGGTTATVCLLRHSTELCIGHVGDSRAILCRRAQSLRLSVDHEPEDENEQKRIKQRGGMVTHNSIGSTMVNNRLAMTRSIGDVELKRFGVTAIPYTRSIQIKHGYDAFLVLTSDGINYVMNDQELCDLISSTKSPSEAANIVTDQALHYGSEDNSSVIIIPFGAWGKYAKTKQSAPYVFGRNILGRRYS